MDAWDDHPRVHIGVSSTTSLTRSVFLSPVVRAVMVGTCHLHRQTPHIIDTVVSPVKGLAERFWG
jgi:hypothetical protein